MKLSCRKQVLVHFELEITHLMATNVIFLTFSGTYYLVTFTSTLLNIRLHVYIYPSYVAKTVVEIFPLHTGGGGLGPPAPLATPMLTV